MSNETSETSAAPASQVLTLEEAMRCARMRREDFYSLPEDFRPKYYRVGKRLYVTQRAVDEWLRRLETAGTVPRIRMKADERPVLA